MDPCEKCKYWIQIGETLNGKCHCWPPWFVLAMVEAATPPDPTHWSHPTTASDDYCSNYSAKE